MSDINENPNTLSEKAQKDYVLVLAAVNDHDQKAYAKLMERYRDSIYYMVLKMVRNEDDAEDLTLEAFGKAFKRLHQYVPKYAFSTWLFKIASNNCIDFLRKKRMFTTSIDESDDDGNDFAPLQLKSTGLNPEAVAIRKQKIEMMREVVNQLKPRYRRLIELRYFNEYSYEEVADELELPLGTVKAQLYRARDFLFQMMKDARGTF